MDKKHTITGVALILAAILSFYVSSKYAPPKPNPAAVRQAATAPAQAPAAASTSVPAANESQTAFVAATKEQAGAVVTTLENDFIQVRFTDNGGALRDVALKKYPATRQGFAPFVFNELHADPMLALVDFPGLDRKARYQLISKSATELVYRAAIPGKLEVTRRYVLSPNQVGATDPYQLRAETTFRNLGSQPTAPMRVAVALGTAAPVNTNDNGLLLTTGYSDGKSQTFIKRSKLESSGGIFGLGAHGSSPAVESPGPGAWAAVGNQFFTAILTPDQPLPPEAKGPAKLPVAATAGLVTRRVKLLTELPDEDRSAYGITDSARFDVPALAAGGAAVLSGNFYVGPKEYHRLANGEVFTQDQDKVMQFGTFKFFSQILLTLMTWIHLLVPNWGLAIVFTTLTLKILFIPLTLKASRSAKRMQKIQPELKAINAKYKDNPQKKNTATMELFKQHKVNPAGGCLPLLLTFPFFFGFFGMLQSTADLRFAPFLWAHDLSAPDTIGHVLGIPINVLPILLGLTSFLQMRLTPQPTVDPAQARMMMFTPVIFLFFCYSYSCALSLYSTTNGIFTIIQQLVINRSREPVDPVPAAPLHAGGRPVKNVTPGKKKR